MLTDSSHDLSERSEPVRSSGDDATARASVEKAKAGDPTVWAEWFDQYYPLVYRYAYFRLRSRADAEDVAAEAFAQALKSIDRFDYRGRPILAWLYRIAHNLVASGRRRQANATPADDAYDERTDFQPGLDQAITNIDLATAVDKLKAEQREVIILRYFLSLPTRQVAEIVGKSESAVFSLQARGLDALRKALADGTRPGPGATG